VIHGAATLEPMGYAGEVAVDAYTRQVLLDVTALGLPCAVEVLDTSAGDSEPLRLRVAPQLISNRMVGELKAVLGEHPGDSPVHLYVEDSVLQLPPEWAVEATVMRATTVLRGEADPGPVTEPSLPTPPVLPDDAVQDDLSLGRDLSDGARPAGAVS
jgi:hypothetical protein